MSTEVLTQNLREWDLRGWFVGSWSDWEENPGNRRAGFETLNRRDKKVPSCYGSRVLLSPCAVWPRRQHSSCVKPSESQRQHAAEARYRQHAPAVAGIRNSNGWIQRGGQAARAWAGKGRAVLAGRLAGELSGWWEQSLSPDLLTARFCMNRQMENGGKQDFVCLQ